MHYRPLLDRALVAVIALGIPGCGFKKMLPEGPVQSAWERTRTWSVERPSEATYTASPLVPYPVLPVQIWGVHYDVDLVLVSTHPSWNMHEYALLRTPEGPIWVAKDAREPTLEQSIVAGLDQMESWLPEIPVPRKSFPIEVVDRSDDRLLDLEIRYENLDGDAVEVTYRGPAPRTLQKKRNGSTMGHSRDALLAVLDVSHRDWGRHASMTIGGEKQRIKRLAGLLPFRMVLQQTQGGLAVARMRQEPASTWGREPGERELVGSPPGEAASAEDAELLAGTDPSFVGTWGTEAEGEQARRWDVAVSDSHVDAWQRDPLRSLHYRFRIDGEAWELISADTWQWGRATPTMHLALSPALPDLRRPFEGRRRSRYVIDVNGQENHAVGWLEAWWDDDGPRVALLPESPWWTLDRPMETTIRFADGLATETHIERVAPVAE